MATDEMTTRSVSAQLSAVQARVQHRTHTHMNQINEPNKDITPKECWTSVLDLSHSLASFSNKNSAPPHSRAYIMPVRACSNHCLCLVHLLLPPTAYSAHLLVCSSSRLLVYSSTLPLLYCSTRHADHRQDADGQDHHPRGRAL
jgi:hypothetical protein